MDVVEKVREQAIKAMREHRVDVDLWGGEDNRELTVDLCYPRHEGNINTLRIGLSDVRASDGIRVSYDFDKDGWKIEQPKRLMSEPNASEINYGWTEVAFIQSWAINEDPEMY